MLRNHLTIAFRVLIRGKVFTAVNLIGIMLGLAIALMIIIYVRFEMSYESSNPLAGITILSRTIGISRSNPIDAIQEE